MALLLPHTDSFGVYHVSSYWRVSNIHINIPAGEVNILVEGYHNSDTRLSSKPYEYKEFLADISVFSVQAMNGRNPIKIAYEDVLKLDPFFQTATDV